MLIAILGAFSARAEPPVVGFAASSVPGGLFKAAPRALYHSQNGGRDWRSVPLPADFGDHGRISSLAISAGPREMLYVSVVGQGIFRTADTGKSWTLGVKGLPTHDVTTLAAHAESPDTLYAVLGKKDIYRSQDAGRNWDSMDEGPAKIERLIHTNMAGSMDTGWLFVGTSDGVQRGMDCFCLWRQAGTLGGDIRGLAYNPQQPKHVYAISDGALFRSQDGGEIWVKLNAPSADLTTLTMTQTGVLYVTTVDGALFRSDDAAVTWAAPDA